MGWVFRPYYIGTERPAVPVTKRPKASRRASRQCLYGFWERPAPSRLGVPLGRPKGRPAERPALFVAVNTVMITIELVNTCLMNMN